MENLEIPDDSTLEFIREMSMGAVIKSKKKVFVAPHKRRKRYPLLDERNNKDTFFPKLYRDISLQPEKFREVFHFGCDVFSYLLSELPDNLIKKPKHHIPLYYRLMITLYYLVTGVSFRKLATLANVGHSTISTIISQTVASIYDTFSPKHLCPPSAKQFEQIAKRFYQKTRFPNIIGVIDGKHIRIQKFSKAGVPHQFLSIMIQCVTDDNSRFLIADVSHPECASEQMFAYDNFFNETVSAVCTLPQSLLPNSTIFAPHVLVGDDAYPLKTWLLKPYPRVALSPNQALFNYKLSLARNSVERAFGILSSRFKHLKLLTHCNTSFILDIIKCDIILHNIIMDIQGADNYELLPEENVFLDDYTPGGGNDAILAVENRDLFCKYISQNE